MAEQQNIEWKQSWHNDYLKTICAFANTDGGSLYIGINDMGVVVGVANTKKLLEDIPAKIHNYLGLIVSVSRETANGNIVVKIDVKPYANAISLKGKYYIRSGSTTQQLTGNALNEFLLKKLGQSWDSLIEENASIDDIVDTPLRYLPVHAIDQRIGNVDDLSKKEVLEKLRLVFNDQTKRACVVLFGKDSNKFYTNLPVKIGAFNDKNELLFQEEISGNLFEVIEATIDVLFKKFLKRNVVFSGFNRIEKGEYPIIALREVILNALVHRNYTGAHTQIKVFGDKLIVWNAGNLPEGFTIASLLVAHPSVPRNPLIAEVCFKAGYIDKWGSGISKILNSCKEADLPQPEFIIENGGMQVTLYKDVFNEKSLKEKGLNKRQIVAVKFVIDNGTISNSQYQEVNNIGRTTATDELKLLVELGVLKGSDIKGRGSVYSLPH